MIVTVRISGMATHDDHCAARNEAWRVCQQKHSSKLLIDLRKLNTLRSSTLDCFSFGESLAHATPRLRLAHVLPNDAKSQRDVKFTSAVEANRGVLTREFETIDEAKNWLLDRT
jgi:hypothetical protein